MTEDDIYISVSVGDDDWPVADIIYEGVQWARMTLADGWYVVTSTVTGMPHHRLPLTMRSPRSNRPSCG